MRCFKYLLGPRPDCNVVSEIHPSDDAIRVEEEFGGSRNVRSFGARPGMQHIIPADNLGVWIGKQRKSVSEFFRLPFVDIRRINADRDNADTAGFEVRKPSLETPQLGVAKRSPKSAIENQRDGLRTGRSAKQIAKANRASVLIQ